VNSYLANRSAQLESVAAVCPGSPCSLQHLNAASDCGLPVIRDCRAARQAEADIDSMTGMIESDVDAIHAPNKRRGPRANCHERATSDALGGRLSRHGPCGHVSAQPKDVIVQGASFGSSCRAKAKSVMAGDRQVTVMGRPKFHSKRAVKNLIDNA